MNGERGILFLKFFPHFPPYDVLYFFRALQLFVRISLHLSSPGMNSRPHVCRDGPSDKELDGSRLRL
jgi:hypothetical protein